MGRVRGVYPRAASIQITFTFDGKQHRKTLYVGGKPLAPTPANLRHAERLAAEIREKIRLGMFSMAEYFPVGDGDSGQAATLRGQLRTWIDSKRIEPSTAAGYESAAKFWSEAIVDGRPLGDRLLKTLRHSDILKPLAQRQDLNGKTINNYVSVIRSALDLAVQDRLISASPAAEVPNAKRQKVIPDPFSRDEAESIVAYARQHFPDQVANLIEFWFYTGLRTSELFGLRWANVDLAGRYFMVSEAIVRGRHKDTTKTSVARKVLLNSRAMAALQRQAAHTRITGEAVFHDPRYDMAWGDERAFRRSYWARSLKVLGIRYRRPYNCRHTYATMMLMAGMLAPFCAKQMGHSVKIFLETYAKWLDGARDDAEMQRLEDSFVDKPLSPGYHQETTKAPKGL